MWALFLLLVINAAANDRGWAYGIRIQLGPLYLNIFLLSLLIALLVALFRPHNRGLEGLTDRPHRLFRWTLGLFALGLLAGVMGVVRADPGLLLDRATGFAIRDYMVMPVAIYIGYKLLSGPTSAKRFLYAMVLAGAAVSVSILLWFRMASEDVLRSSSVNSVRTVAFLSDQAGLACLLLFYAIAAGRRLLRLWVAVAVAGLCVLGQFAPLNRSSWIAFAGGLLACIPLLPAQRRWKSIFGGCFALAVLATSLWFGLGVASRWTRWDFGAKMEHRVLSLIPGTEDSKYQTKAWATRLPGIMAELGIWSESPIVGGGFGVQERRWLTAGDSVHHNAYSDTLAKAGIVGLIPFLMVLGGCVVVGFRLMRDSTDRYLSLVGALGAITGVYYMILGMATWSFNSERGAICLGLIFGALLKCRHVQVHLAEAEESTEEVPRAMELESQVT